MQVFTGDDEAREVDEVEFEDVSESNVMERAKFLPSLAEGDVRLLVDGVHVHAHGPRPFLQVILYKDVALKFLAISTDEPLWNSLQIKVH